MYQNGFYIQSFIKLLDDFINKLEYLVKPVIRLN